MNSRTLYHVPYTTMQSGHLVGWFLTFLPLVLNVLGASSASNTNTTNQTGRYTPDWVSLDTRPLPKWFDEARIGIFIHWGIFSVPSFVDEWFWWRWQGDPPNPAAWTYMSTYYRAGFSYADFAKDFRAEFFYPEQWAEMFKNSGAKYIVLTSKHHEGYCNWPSKVSWNWNSKDVGPRRDLVGDLAKAIRKKTDLKFGLYHSLFEWFNPLYLADKKSGFKEQNFVDKKTMPELYDLVNTYHPSLIWSDGDFGEQSAYWKSTEFLAWLYNDSPVKDEVVVNDRWGLDTNCKHGDYFNCADRYHPGQLLAKKWEACISLDRHAWGYRRDSRLADYLTPEEMLEHLVDTITFGGNFLLNVGATSWGTIAPIFEERLALMGQWLKVNGEAVYTTLPWKYQRDTLRPWTWYMQQKTTENEPFVYAFFGQWQTVGGENQKLPLAQVKAIEGKSKFTLLDGGGPGTPLIYHTDPNNGTVVIDLPTNQPLGTFIIWTVRMESVLPS